MLTTPCIGAALFPGCSPSCAERHPGVRVTLSEQSWHDVERRFLGRRRRRRRPADRWRTRSPPGLREQVLWREPIRVVVPARPRARAGRLGRSRRERLVQHPLVVSGTAAETEPEVLALLAARGLAVQPRAARRHPADAGGAWSEPASASGSPTRWRSTHADTTGLVVLDIDDPDMVREVAAYWYDVLLSTGVGKAAAAQRCWPRRSRPAPWQPVAPRLADGVFRQARRR